jgi:hypothetical protein
MRKSVTLLLITLMIIPLSACGVFKSASKDVATTKVSADKIDRSKLEHNIQVWNDRIKSATVETTTTDHSGDYATIPTSITELKKYNPILVEGTVYNLKPMKGADNEAHTKVTVFVNKVINGNKSLQNTYINFNLNSGFIYKPDQKKYNYIKKAEVPLPQISSKIITGITPRTVQKTSKDPLSKFFIENGLADNKSYQLNDPVYAFWDKKATDSSYHLNNPFLTRNLKDDWYAKKLLDLTDQLNKIVN